MKSFGHQRPVRNDAGEITGMVISPVRVRTIQTLEHAYGPDHDKRLVLTSHPRDIIGLRPERTQRELFIEAKDLYAHLIRLEANRALLQKARGPLNVSASASLARNVSYSPGTTRKDPCDNSPSSAANTLDRSAKKTPPVSF
jgi:hypothetical protein